jgi:hypothetical protein
MYFKFKVTLLRVDEIKKLEKPIDPAKFQVQSSGSFGLD